jgi:hypothetical protein
MMLHGHFELMFTSEFGPILAQILSFVGAPPAVDPEALR